MMSLPSLKDLQQPPVPTTITPDPAGRHHSETARTHSGSKPQPRPVDHLWNRLLLSGGGCMSMGTHGAGKGDDSSAYEKAIPCGTLDLSVGRRCLGGDANGFMLEFFKAVKASGLKFEIKKNLLYLRMQLDDPQPVNGSGSTHLGVLADFLCNAYGLENTLRLLHYHDLLSHADLLHEPPGWLHPVLDRSRRVFDAFVQHLTLRLVMLNPGASSVTTRHGHSDGRDNRDAMVAPLVGDVKFEREDDLIVDVVNELERILVEFSAPDYKDDFAFYLSTVEGFEKVVICELQFYAFSGKTAQPGLSYALAIYESLLAYITKCRFSGHLPDKLIGELRRFDDSIPANPADAAVIKTEGVDISDDYYHDRLGDRLISDVKKEEPISNEDVPIPVTPSGNSDLTNQGLAPPSSVRKCEKETSGITRLVGSDPKVSSNPGTVAHSCPETEITGTNQPSGETAGFDSSSTACTDNDVGVQERSAHNCLSGSEIQDNNPSQIPGPSCGPGNGLSFSDNRRPIDQIPNQNPASRAAEMKPPEDQKLLGTSTHHQVYDVSDDDDADDENMENEEYGDDEDWDEREEEAEPQNPSTQPQSANPEYYTAMIPGQINLPPNPAGPKFNYSSPRGFEHLTTVYQYEEAVWKNDPRWAFLQQVIAQYVPIGAHTPGTWTLELKLDDPKIPRMQNRHAFRATLIRMRPDDASKMEHRNSLTRPTVTQVLYAILARLRNMRRDYADMDHCQRYLVRRILQIPQTTPDPDVFRALMAQAQGRGTRLGPWFSDVRPCGLLAVCRARSADPRALADPLSALAYLQWNDNLFLLFLALNFILDRRAYTPVVCASWEDILEFLTHSWNSINPVAAQKIMRNCAFKRGNVGKKKKKGGRRKGVRK